MILTVLVIYARISGIVNLWQICCNVRRQVTISNWVHLYREECQINDEGKTKLGLMEELRKI